jgi:ATP-binding protein involved in chromosome partitioning
MDRERMIKFLKEIYISGEEINIVDNQSLTEIFFSKEEIVFHISLQYPAMLAKKKLEYDISKAIQDTKIKIHTVINHQRKKNTGRELPGVKSIIAIASGKGGVGKSTLAGNITITLSKMGFKVGILDADLYGPSIPIMFNSENVRVSSLFIEGKEKIKPHENYGVKMLSLGFFAHLNKAVIWRGPMAVKALRQLIRDSYWGNIDFLVVDFPPGTGDIHISLFHEFTISGAIVVSTPQKLSLADVKRTINMLRLQEINVPILGIVENMAFFKLKDPPKKYFPFGEKGAKKLSIELGLTFLGEIPIVEDLQYISDTESGLSFPKKTLANKVLKKISKNILIGIDSPRNFR